MSTPTDAATLAVLVVEPTAPGHDLANEQNPIRRVARESADQHGAALVSASPEHLVLTAPTASLALAVATTTGQRLSSDAGLHPTTVRYGLAVAEVRPAGGQPSPAAADEARSLAAAAESGAGVASTTARLLAATTTVTWGATDSVDVEDGPAATPFEPVAGTDPAPAPPAPEPGPEPEPAPPPPPAPTPPPPPPGPPPGPPSAPSPPPPPAPPPGPPPTRPPGAAPGPPPPPPPPPPA